MQVYLVLIYGNLKTKESIRLNFVYIKTSLELLQYLINRTLFFCQYNSIVNVYANEKL